MADRREITFVFQRDPSYRVVPVNGVWGGVTTRGDLRVDFFVESNATPESVTNLLTSEGGLGDEVARKPEQRFLVRELQVGVLLNIENAESIGNWLLEKVKEYREKIAEKEAKP